jgi:hypothetical protein
VRAIVPFGSFEDVFTPFRTAKMNLVDADNSQRYLLGSPYNTVALAERSERVNGFVHLDGVLESVRSGLDGFGLFRSVAEPMKASRTIPAHHNRLADTGGVTAAEAPFTEWVYSDETVAVWGSSPLTAVARAIAARWLRVRSCFGVPLVW